MLGSGSVGHGGERLAGRAGIAQYFAERAGSALPIAASSSDARRQSRPARRTNLVVHAVHA